MPTVTNVEQVKLNIMTSAQYTAATKNANEFYLVTDDDTFATKSYVDSVVGDIETTLHTINSGS